VRAAVPDHEEREVAVKPGSMIRVLGPVDVLTPDGVCSVGGLHSRRLLGALVISVAHAVPADHLIDVVWGEAPPRTAQATLQSLVSRLRQIVGPDSILLVDHSYLLSIELKGVDALHFERLVASAQHEHDAERRRALCQEALALWRGVPFGDLADDDPFRLEALRLDELRMSAMELRLAADVELGDTDLAVAYLRAAIEEHPYREKLWHLLIEALAADGRRVEALRECERLRQVLAEVGLEADDALRGLAEAIALRGSSPA
jgi:DNA-binding SARP family transcriptional activator